MAVILSLLAGAALATGTLEVTAERHELVLGTDAGLTLTISGSDETPEVFVNTGTVSAPRAADGRHSVVYTPPAARFPQLAIFFVRTKSAHKWFVLPLHGKETLSLETKKLATVEVMVGDKTFGPVKADAKGRLKVPVVVPPGIDTASARSIDLAGNTKIVSVPLDPPPFRSIYVGVVTSGAARWSDSKPHGLEAFVATPAGAPRKGATLVATASQGSLSPAKEVDPGVYAFEYRAPEVLKGDTASVQVGFRDAPPVEARVPLGPGPPARLTLAFEPPQAAAGAAVNVIARVQDAKGNPVTDARPTLSADFGALVEQSIRVPENTKGRASIAVTASLPPLSQSAALPLVAPPVVRGTVQIGAGLARAGEPMDARVHFFDRFDNPIADAAFAVTAPAGAMESSSPEPSGGQRVRFRVAANVPAGSTTFSVTAGGVTVSSPLTVLPEIKPWGVAIGVSVGAGINFARTMHLVPALELAVRPGFWPVELVLDAGARLYLPRSGDFTAAGAGAVLSAQLYGLPITVGARYNLLISLMFSLYFSLHGGIQPSWSILTSSGGTTSLAQRGFAVAPVVGAAIGAAVRAGPGRFIADFGWQLVYGLGDVQGNLGGFGLRVGYLYDAR